MHVIIGIVAILVCSSLMSRAFVAALAVPKGPAQRRLFHFSAVMGLLTVLGWAYCVYG